MPTDVATPLASAAAAAAVFVLTGGRAGPPRLRRLSGSRLRRSDVVLDPRRRGARRAGGGVARDQRTSTHRGGDARDRSPDGLALLAPHAPLTAGTATEPADTRMRSLAAVMAGLGLAVVVGGVLGVVVGIAASVTAYFVVGRLEPRAVRQRRDCVLRDLPAAASLLAAAVSAGATPVAAVEVVAVAIGGPLGHDLYRLAASARLGGDFPVSTTGDAGEPVARLSRVIARAIATGAPLAASLDRLATDLHAERRFDVDRRARSVGVRAAAPLGLCFLPGFLLIGVIPVIAGIASTVLGTVL